MTSSLPTIPSLTLSDPMHSVESRLRDVHAWHALAADEVLQALDSSTAGLSPSEAAERLAILGPNVLPRAKGEGWLRLLIRQVSSPLVLILVVSGMLAIALGKGIDGLVVLGVVVLNALVGLVQEHRAGRAIQELDDLVSETASVVRGDRLSVVPAADLVLGDVVRLEAGDRVPADARVIAARGLQVDEAALTGESVAALKATAPVLPTASLGDRAGMLFSGTLVKAGTGTAVVVETGAQTELGRISMLLNEIRSLETPLMRQLDRVGTLLTVGIAAVAGVFFAVALVRGFSFVDAVLAAITLAVAAIPEGLPAIVTIALAVGVQRMARRRAVVRHLPAVETLGGTTVICSDKTGTLTKGEMTVRALWTPLGRYTLTGTGYAPEGALVREPEPGPLDNASVAYGDGASSVVAFGGEALEDARALLLGGVLCSDALVEDVAGAWRVVGDPTEGALVVAAQKVGLDAEVERRRWPRLDAVPFASEKQYMATLHVHPAGGRMLLVKGAPEVVLHHATLLPGDRHAAVLAEVDRMAAAGLRVLAFGYRLAEGEGIVDDDVRGLHFLGLQGMIDPPRPEAVEAVAACHRAGIRVTMITGDHPATAAAIGGQIGLRTGRVVRGEELAEMADADLADALAEADVFARVAPEQKLRLVEALQAGGEVVAMTGDGVNDAPALKRADVGVAMGSGGTAAAREAAAVVLTDDNFASITAAVEEGRRVYDNLVKSLAFILPTNIGEALIVLVAVAFFPLVDGLPLLPMLPVQVLWINLVATVSLALPLAFEALEPDAMGRPPRDPRRPILDRAAWTRTAWVALVMAAGAVGLFLWTRAGALGAGASPDFATAQAQTAAVTATVLFQAVYLLQCRSLRGSALRMGLGTNPWVYLGIAVIVVLQACFVYAVPMHHLFGSAPLDVAGWGWALAVAFTAVPAVAVEKRWRAWRGGR